MNGHHKTLSANRRKNIRAISWISKTKAATTATAKKKTARMWPIWIRVNMCVCIYCKGQTGHNECALMRALLSHLSHSFARTPATPCRHQLFNAVQQTVVYGMCLLWMHTLSLSIFTIFATQFSLDFIFSSFLCSVLFSLLLHIKQ